MSKILSGTESARPLRVDGVEKGLAIFGEQ